MKPLRLRSMLFVPADSERKLAKGGRNPADVLILDLEDAVAEPRKSIARKMAADYIASEASMIAPRLFVRINPFDTPFAMADLAAVTVPGLAGILLPKTRSAADVVRLGHGLDALEARAGIAHGTVKIVPVATETADAMLNMASFQGIIPRLAGVTWGAEDLATAIGAVTNREEDGEYSPLYTLASSYCLCAAAATSTKPIDTVFTDFRDHAGFERACRQSRRRGFKGRMAIHPDQSAIINATYAPSAAEIEHAKRIVAAFAADPNAGALSIDGQMIDRPHLVQAQRVLADV